jgi:pimeloyl-ACP methyl ester carboxylesterase
VYEQAVVPQLLRRDLRVYLIAYPGQFGSDSAAPLGELRSLAGAAIEQVARECSSPKLVIVGRSLGSMIAAYAAQRGHAAGLVLESTSPRFSTFLRTNLRARWYLWPLVLLPVQRLLKEDYSLNAALTGIHRPVVIFQGTKDELTPISDLATESFPQNVKVISVENATHSNTFSLALPQYVATILDMLSQASAP